MNLEASEGRGRSARAIAFSPTDEVDRATVLLLGRTELVAAEILAPVGTLIKL